MLTVSALDDDIQRIPAIRAQVKLPLGFKNHCIPKTMIVEAIADFCSSGMGVPLFWDFIGISQLDGFVIVDLVAPGGESIMTSQLSMAIKGKIEDMCIKDGIFFHTIASQCKEINIGHAQELICSAEVETNFANFQGGGLGAGKEKKKRVCIF